MNFRYRSGLGLSYERQGFVYFASRTYKEQPKRVRDKIDRLCRECGGEHADALREFVTTDAEAAAVCRKHFMSTRTLYRATRNYFREF